MSEIKKNKYTKMLYKPRGAYQRDTEDYTYWSESAARCCFLLFIFHAAKTFFFFAEDLLGVLSKRQCVSTEDLKAAVRWRELHD